MAFAVYGLSIEALKNFEKQSRKRIKKSKKVVSIGMIYHSVLCGLWLGYRDVDELKKIINTKSIKESKRIVSIGMIYHIGHCGLWLGYLGATGVGLEHWSKDRDSASRHRSGARATLATAFEQTD